MLLLVGNSVSSYASVSYMVRVSMLNAILIGDIGTVAVSYIVLPCGLSVQDSNSPALHFWLRKPDSVSTMKLVEVFNLRSSCFARVKTGILYVKLCMSVLRGPRVNAKCLYDWGIFLGNGTCFRSLIKILLLCNGKDKALCLILFTIVFQVHASVTFIWFECHR